MNIKEIRNRMAKLNYELDTETNDELVYRRLHDDLGRFTFIGFVKEDDIWYNSGVEILYD